MTDKLKFGSIVAFYHPTSKSAGKPLHKSPAIVQKVNADNTLDICVFSLLGYADFRKGIERGQKEYHWDFIDK